MGQPPATPPVSTRQRGPESDTSKVLAALSYPLWFPVAIIALLIDPYKEEKFVRFHAYQGIAVGLAGYVVTWAISVLTFGVGGILGLAVFVYEIILALKAWNGEYVEVPVLYGFIKNYLRE